jgi:hypothetical protein
MIAYNGLRISTASTTTSTMTDTRAVSLRATPPAVADRSCELETLVELGVAGAMSTPVTRIGLLGQASVYLLVTGGTGR